MKLSTAIQLGHSRRVVEWEPDRVCIRTEYVTQSPRNTLLLDSLASAHLGVYRSLSVFRGSKETIAHTITGDMIDAFPILASHVKYISLFLVKELRRILPSRSCDWSLFKVITELDRIGYTDTAKLLERNGL